MSKKPTKNVATDSPPDSLIDAPTQSPLAPSGGPDLPQVVRDQMIDPASCELMPGKQHAATGIGELAESMAVLGQLHPGQVCEFPDGGRWVATGRRRWLACKERVWLYRADIWKCPTRDSAQGENLGRILRIVENEQRQDPSAYDLAVQVRNLRNQYGTPSSAELGRRIGMSPSRVRTYLGLFRASDSLLSAIETEGLSIDLATTLLQCERQFGEVKTRGLTRKVIAGEMSRADLCRRRTAARRGGPDAKTDKKAGSAPRKRSDADWSSVTKAMRRLMKADPLRASQELRALLADVPATK